VLLRVREREAVAGEDDCRRASFPTRTGATRAARGS